MSRLLSDMFDEREIVRKILLGDFRAFTVLVRQYEKLVFFMVNRIVLNHADQSDICQEVFLKIHQNLPRFKQESKLSTWIARIAYLTAVDHLRKFHHDKHYDKHDEDLDNFYFTTEDPGHILEEKERLQLLEMLIAELPENYRVAITLYHLNEFSCREIEEITGVPEGTVKSNLFRARQLLKDKIKKQFKEEAL